MCPAHIGHKLVHQSFANNVLFIAAQDLDCTHTYDDFTTLYHRFGVAMAHTYTFIDDDDIRAEKSSHPLCAHLNIKCAMRLSRAHLIHFRIFQIIRAPLSLRVYDE